MENIQTTENPIEMYLNSLNDRERKSYEIAKQHLGCSFQIYKSNAFIKWCKDNNVVYKHKYQ